MRIEKMNEQIEKWKAQKQVYDEQMDKKISAMERERDLAVAAATQKIFAKHHLSADELLRLKHANKEQLQRLIDFIEEEIEEPAKPVKKPDEKSEKEIENHAKEVNT